MLAKGAAEAAEFHGAMGVFVDLADYPLPLYDGDLEMSEGIPENARALGELMRGADALFIASPEYNGAYSALLKNTFDWLSRIDRTILARPTAIGSASPGSSGGANGLNALRSTLEHMRVPVIEHQLSVPRAHEVLARDGRAEGEAADAMYRIIASLLSETESTSASPCLV
jgi:NAD(P)H-dependent FMN reductase